MALSSGCVYTESFNRGDRNWWPLYMQLVIRNWLLLCCFMMIVAFVRDIIVDNVIFRRL